MTTDHDGSKSQVSSWINRSAQLYGRTAEFVDITGYFTSPAAEALAIVLKGEGGVGKTSLLAEIENYLKQQQLSFLPLYDFYHIDHFKASAIEQRIIEALDAPDSEGEHFFSRYRKQYEQVEHARQSGAAFREAQKKLRETFVACYNNRAGHEHDHGRPVVLLFDSVEQAVDLSDEAEVHIHGIVADPSKGGAFWLEAILPQLHNTVVILAGRQQTLYGQPVEMYDRLSPHMTVHSVLLQGIPHEDERQFVRDRQAALAGDDKPRDLRELARSLIADEQTFERTLIVWRAISGGLPFWDSMLLTAAILGVTPPEVEHLHEAAFAGEHINLDVDRRRAIRAAVMRGILQLDVRENSQPLTTVLQWMAFIRKGAAPAILQSVARTLAYDLEIKIDLPEVYNHLKHLDIVKRRQSPTQQQPDSLPEDLLFLHDEIYHWLDQDESPRASSSAAVSAALMQFYDQEITETEQRQLAMKERLLQVGPRHQEAPRLGEQIRAEQQRKQQLMLDYIGYCYQTAPTLGTREYNLQSYAAILDREAGYSVMLRQEALRNLYRLHDHVPYNVVVECAARWVLRATHTDDPNTMNLVDKLQFYYDQEDKHPGLHYALLYLADAQARISFGKAADRTKVLTQLERAEQMAREYEQRYREQHRDAVDPWCNLLLAQIYNWRGYYYRSVTYNLPTAVQEYRHALALYSRQPGLLPQFLGEVLNDLAFACSEQGEVDDAQHFGRQGLAIRQRYGSDYHIGLSHNTLARIALQASMPQRAVLLAQQAHALFDQIGSVRGLMLCLPVLGESYRKQADQQVESISEQDATFRKGVETLERAIDLVKGEDAPADRRREAYQRLGSLYRTWGVTLLRRRMHDPQQVAECFAEAQRWLLQALHVAEEQNLPQLVAMDICQDLAVVLINQDQFDERVEQYLDKAESLAPHDYRIERGIGLRDMAQPIRAYWRTLGQCQLQRMLIGFGKFDFGSHRKGADGVSYYEEQGNEQFLKDAAEHLVLALAYLMKYAYQSPLLDQVRALALRELRLGRSGQQLKLMGQQAYRTAREYQLRGGQELKLATDLMLMAQRDLDLPLGLMQ